MDTAKDTVNFADESDVALSEQVVMPVAIRNLLGTGATSIPVGTATDSPPHTSDQRRRSRGVRRPARLGQAIGQWRHRAAGITPAVERRQEKPR